MRMSTLAALLLMVTSVAPQTPPAAKKTAGFASQFGDITAYEEANVKRLVSGSMDVKELKLPIFGIALAGDIRLASRNNDVFSAANATATIADTSTFVVYILDEVTRREKKPAITIGFRKGAHAYRVAGRITNGKYATITFSDKFGDIVLEGNFDRTTFRGNAFFTTKNSLEPKRRFPLGDFRVPTCGFFHCE